MVHCDCEFTLEEISRHNGKDDPRTWIIYKDSVYDVTDYLAQDEHPGGIELIEEFAGKDATKAFNDAGHSSDAKKLLETFKIGEVTDAQRRTKKNKKKNKTNNEKSLVILETGEKNTKDDNKENEQRYFTHEEISQHNGKDDHETWIIYKDSVYDLTLYLAKEEHPGGNELIEEFAGKDATKAFDDFGHSGDAKRLMKTFKIGELVEEERKGNKKQKKAKVTTKEIKKSTKTEKNIMEELNHNVQYFTLEEVAKRNGKDEPKTWIIYKDGVYDVTKYLESEEHPGGNDLINEFAGKDATKGFDDYGHSGDAKKQLATYKIGEIVQEQRRKNLKKKAEASANSNEKYEARSALSIITCGLIQC